MDVYRIAVSIALSNGVSPVLAIIGRDLLGLKTSIGQVEQGFSKWATAIGGVAAVLGGSMMLKGLEDLAKHGGDVNHQLELMKIAGMENGEIQASVAQAMKTSGTVMTTTLSENLAHIRELRYAFGDTSVAMSHMDEVSKANMILNAVKGNSGNQDQVWELVKSLEGKGLTFDPEQFSSYVNTMTKVVEATGGKVTPQMFMSTFKYGRTATLGWDEEFVGGALPRLIQSMASSGGGGGAGTGGPGNALMSAFAKIVQGQMSKTAAEEFQRMGLGSAKHIEGSEESQIEGGIKGRDQFMTNPYEWVQKTLMPALAARGITNQNDIVSEISKMFPVRTASQVITEMALQGRFHEGENSPFEKDTRLQHGAMGLASAADELSKHDYPTVLKEFNQQWTNMLQTLGSPLMAPGGPVLGAMAGLTATMNSMSQFAGANPEAVKYIAYAIGAIGVALVAIGGIALGTLVGIPAAITGIVAAVIALGALEWDKVRGYLLAFNQAITDFIHWLGSIADKVKGLFSGVGGGNSDPLKKGLDDANKNYVPMRFTPGSNQPKPQPISLSLNVDGRTLAQSMSEQLESLYGFPTTAPSSNGWQGFRSPDDNKYAT